jgi:hypothetical protein
LFRKFTEIPLKLQACEAGYKNSILHLKSFLQGAWCSKATNNFFVGHRKLLNSGGLRRYAGSHLFHKISGFNQQDRTGQHESKEPDRLQLRMKTAASAKRVMETESMGGSSSLE